MHFRLTAIRFGVVFATLVSVACGNSDRAAAAPAGQGPRMAQHEHADGHDGMAGMPSMEAAEHGSSGSAWAELKQTRDAIAELIESGKLAEVHKQAERLERLGQALTDGAQSLPDEKRSRVEATLRQVPPLAKALDAAGDSGSAEATRRELKRLDGLLSLIEAQYPADALGKVPAPAEPHGETPHSEAAPSGHEHAGHMHTTRPLAAVDDAPKATIHVIAGEFKFEPKSLVIKAGQPTRIELENEGAIEHALIVEAPDGRGDWIHLHAAVHTVDAATFRIDQRGKYRVVCTIPGHTEAGMVGELVVQ